MRKGRVCHTLCLPEYIPETVPVLVLVDDSEGNSITRVALRLALVDGVDVKRPETNQKMRRGSVVLHTAHVVPWLTYTWWCRGVAFLNRAEFPPPPCPNRGIVKEARV